MLMNKFLLKIKSMLVILIFGISAQMGFSQALLVEDFDYPSSDPLLNHNWVIQGTSTVNPFLIGSENLTYTNYPMTNGKSVPMLDNGQDAYREFASQSTGNVYMAFIVKVTAATTTGDYFISLKESTSSTNYRGRVFVKADGTDATKIYFGLNKGSNETAVTYSSTQYLTNTTYLLVLKYSFIDGTANDAATLYIQPSLPASEPASPDVTAADLTITDVNLSCVLLRQGATGKAASLIVDGIRVATTWTDAISDVTAPVATIVPADAATDVAIDVVPTITYDEAIRNTDASEITDANLTSLVKFKKTNSIGTDVPCTMTIDAAKKVITITPSTALDNAQAYYLEVGETEDAFGNTGVVKTSTFTTISAATPAVELTAPVGGETFYAGQNVNFTWTSANVTNIKIEVYIPGDGIYQEIIASTPASAGTYAYTIPAEADYSAGYKIKISDVANPNTCIDESGAFTVIGVATSISDLRSRFVVADVVKLSSEAVISFISGKNYYIQDAGAGLLIYDSGLKLTTVYAQYDGMTGLTGTLADYNGVLEIIPIADAGAATSTGNTLTPLEVNAVSLNSDINTYESRLVKILGMTFADAGGVFAKGSNYNISDGTTTTIFRAAFTSDITGATIPNMADIVGLAMEYKGAAQIASRSLADLTIYSSAKAITAFAFNGLSPVVNATIDEGAKTIAATVPAGTDRATLVPTITISDKATVSPASGSTVDCTSPVTFTVKAEDGTTQDYIATISVGTGTDDTEAALVTLRPVPATTRLEILNMESVKLIEVFNVAGVKIETVKCAGLTNLPLSLDSYRPGLYFIRFTTPKGTFMKKFMKQ